MNWDYIKDKRSDEQVKRDFDFGKKAQKLIIEKLKEYTEVEVIEKDQFKKIDKYTPDIIMNLRGLSRPIEIKFTKRDLTRVDWKLNQWGEAMECHGLLLQVSGKKLCLINPTDDHYKVESGYCNKPCMRFKPKWFYSFESIFNQ